MHSPILGINFHVAYNRSVVSLCVRFSYFISLSLNQLRMIESPRIFVTKNITRQTLLFNFYYTSMKSTYSFFFRSCNIFSFYSRPDHKVSVLFESSLRVYLIWANQLLIECIFQCDMPTPPPSPGLDGLAPMSSILSYRSSLSFYTLFLTSPMFSFSVFSTFVIFLLDSS